MVSSPGTTTTTPWRSGASIDASAAASSAEAGSFETTTSGDQPSDGATSRAAAALVRPLARSSRSIALCWAERAISASASVGTVVQRCGFAFPVPIPTS